MPKNSRKRPEASSMRTKYVRNSLNRLEEVVLRKPHNCPCKCAHASQAAFATDMMELDKRFSCKCEFVANHKCSADRPKGQEASTKSVPESLNNFVFKQLHWKSVFDGATGKMEIDDATNQHAFKAPFGANSLERPQASSTKQTNWLNGDLNFQQPHTWPFNGLSADTVFNAAKRPEAPTNWLQGGNFQQPPFNRPFNSLSADRVFNAANRPEAPTNWLQGGNFQQPHTWPFKKSFSERIETENAADQRDFFNSPKLCRLCKVLDRLHNGERKKELARKYLIHQNEEMHQYDMIL